MPDFKSIFASPQPQAALYDPSEELKMGGKLLGLTMDPAFSNTLDALILVDLRLTQRNMLERYISKAEASSFCVYHKLDEMGSKRIAS